MAEKKSDKKKKPLKKRIQNGIRKVKLAVKKKKASIKKKVNPSPSRKRAKKQKSEEIIVSHQFLKPESSAYLNQTIISEEERIEKEKFSPAQTPSSTFFWDLPDRYNDNKIVLLPRDPWWLYTYWDISAQRIEEVKSKIRTSQFNIDIVLRVYDITGKESVESANSFFDILVSADKGSWYIHTNSPEREWIVEIGLKTAEGKFFPLARSNRIKSPYFGISDKIDEQWALADDDFFMVVGGREGFNPLKSKSSLARRQAIEKMLHEQISSHAFSGGVSSLFSSLPGKGKQRKFFLEVWTEVIVYGRTEADANVTIAGKKVNLRPDGTFSQRYALPEGKFRYDVIATSADKEDTITIVPGVERYTIEE